MLLAYECHSSKSERHTVVYTDENVPVYKLTIVKLPKNVTLLLLYCCNSVAFIEIISSTLKIITKYIILSLNR